MEDKREMKWARGAALEREKNNIHLHACNANLQANWLQQQGAPHLHACNANLANWLQQQGLTVFSHIFRSKLILSVVLLAQFGRI